MTSHMIHCLKLQHEAEGLETPPLPGALGQKIYDHISKEAWGLWLRHQTMLINEYRLNLLDKEASQFLKAEMEKFLFGEGSALPPGYAASEKE